MFSLSTCVCWIGLGVLACSSFAQAEELPVRSLPREVLKSFEKLGIQERDLSAHAIPIPPFDGRQLAGYSHAANQLMNPASVVKVFTTGLALDRLSVNYRFKTGFHIERQPVDGVLQGNLYIKGGGDPGLLTSDIWSALRALRSKGLRTIRGNMVLDDTVFSDQGMGLSSADTGVFDDSPYRAYHAQPYGLLLNHGAMMLHFNVNQNTVQITPDEAPQDWAFVSELTAVGGACGAWKNGLDVSLVKKGSNVVLTVRGNYPRACGASALPVRIPPQDWLWESWLRECWAQLGGEFSGQVIKGRTPASTEALYTLEGKPLIEHVKQVNTWSNNVMARHLELAVAGSPNAFNGTMQDWLRGLGLNTRDWFFENGSGLSRSTRVNAAGLTQFLRSMSVRADFPDYLASFPQAGVDGTLQRRAKGLEGHAYLKTGSLNGVRALAGYVRDQHGQWWAVAVMVRGDNAAQAWPAMEKFLEGVYRS